jgi:hypothetical protein
MIRRTCHAALLLLAGHAQAAAGLWQPAQLPAIEEALRAAGVAVDPRELADLQRYPMNALVDFGGNCTATLVSPLGLLLTSHRCARATIDFNSTVDRDLRNDGLVARTLGEELPGAPGLRVLLTQSAQEVTDQVLAESSSGGAEGDAAAAIGQRSRRLVAACESVPGFRCRVDRVQGTDQYILLKQMEIRDVRLVYAPPAAVAEFGGDVDIWPSHAGGFALFRAYMGPHARPAEYGESNVPLRSGSHLRLQPAGLTSGDFAMVVGYPGARQGATAGNRSLGVSFGKVRAEGADVTDPAFTDLAGLVARHTGTPPYAISARQLGAMTAGKLGPYAAMGSVPVNFLTDFEAGVSSGAPLLNARAELVGLIVGGDRETSAPLPLSDRTRARGIAADIRYLLWMMDAVDRADSLLEEMGITPGIVDAPQ